jgi:hypothetical protein
MNLLFCALQEHRKDPRLRNILGRLRADLAAGVACVFLLTGCLYSTAHFNAGRVLEPGRTSLTLGGGGSKTLSFGCEFSREYNGYDYSDSTGSHCVEFENRIDSNGVNAFVQDTTPAKKLWHPGTKYSLDYRLGILGKWGPFPGADIGLHFEAPTNPATGEFDFRLGLPVPGKRPWHHSLSAGWGIGVWADNSYFLEYALSRSWGENALFANYRATHLATQFADLVDAETDRRFAIHPRLIHQASLGFDWELPEIPVIPDFIVPQAILTYPLAPAGTNGIPDYLLDEHMWTVNGP